MTASHRDHIVSYAIIVVLVTALAIAGVLSFSYKRQSQEANQKAAQLMQLWAERGLKSTEDQASLVRLYGTDGGAVCKTSTGDLAQALLKTGLANGAAGPGQRPVIVDRRLLSGERAVVEVYCPDHLVAFDEFTNDLRYSHVSRDL